MIPRLSKRVVRTLALGALLLAILVVPMGTAFAQPNNASVHDGLIGSGSAVQSSPSSSSVGITLNQTSINARTGDLVNITSTVNNTGNASIGPATVYLTLMDVKTHAPLDLEDWAATRAHQIRSLGAGHATAQNWSVKAIKGGTYRVFIVVVPKNVPSGSQRTTAVSHGVNIMITQRNNINPGNVLPTIIGVPVGLVALAGAVVSGRRRNLRRYSDRGDSGTVRSGGDEP